MQPAKQHIIYRFANDYNMCKKNGSLIELRREPDGSMSYIPSGPILFWLSFGYDLFCLMNKNLLTQSLIDRLKNHQHFQGARYELAIAAIVLRAGCDIKWINKDDFENKTCEFEAIHKESNTKFVVEAKSRKRTGIIHEPGKPSDESKGFASLLKNAQRKNIPEKSFLIIFIDDNLPFEAVSHEEKNILRETKRAIGTLFENCDYFNLLIVTNFPFHYDNITIPASPSENVIVLPKNNQAPPPSLIEDLDRSLKTYAKIPEEV